MSFASLDIIMGPMFSGKSTELIRRLNIFSELNFPTLYINSKLDDRSSKDFSTHNPTIKSIGKIASIKLEHDFSIELLQKNIDLDTFNVIGIDEAQLFKGLEKVVIELVQKYNKKVIIAGLNGDYKREKFGEIIDLIPFADNVSKLNSVCSFCSVEKGQLIEAPFTKRMSDSIKTILIGGDSVYKAACRKCYYK